MAQRTLYHNLEQRRETWYVVLDVPPALRDRIGRKRLRRTTGTPDKREALLRRGPILHEMRMEIERARRGAKGIAEGGLIGEGLSWRQELAADRPPEDRISLEVALVERAEQLEERHGVEAAKAFVAVADGSATPLTLHLEEWLSEAGYKDRQKADFRNFLDGLAQWLRGRGLVETLEVVSDKNASAFKAETIVKSGVNFKTGNKRLSGLRTYWRWLVRQGYSAGNPWLGKSLPKVRGRSEDKERPFTDEEVTILINGAADETMLDLMKVAALSGMRLEEIYQVKSRHCREGVFRVVGGKTEAAERDVPVHPQLEEIVARRLKGKTDEGYLFEDATKGWDDVRSGYASKRFAAYRKKLGIDEQREGKRRSLVNFHSFRRWFITKADQAGMRKEDIERVVGHKVEGESLGLYSSGITLEQRRRVVLSVNLPEGKLSSK